MELYLCYNFASCKPVKRNDIANLNTIPVVKDVRCMQSVISLRHQLTLKSNPLLFAFTRILQADFKSVRPRHEGAQL